MDPLDVIPENRSFPSKETEVWRGGRALHGLGEMLMDPLKCPLYFTLLPLYWAVEIPSFFIDFKPELIKKRFS